MFQDLDPISINIIVNAMEEHKAKAGEVVIKQNDEGSCLYIVESGVLSCTKLFVMHLCNFFSLKKLNPNY